MSNTDISIDRRYIPQLLQYYGSLVDNAQFDKMLKTLEGRGVNTQRIIGNLQAAQQSRQPAQPQPQPQPRPRRQSFQRLRGQRGEIIQRGAEIRRPEDRARGTRKIQRAEKRPQRRQGLSDSGRRPGQRCEKRGDRRAGRKKEKQQPAPL